jgi:hypothetical protein
MRCILGETRSHIFRAAGASLPFLAVAGTPFSATVFWDQLQAALIFPVFFTSPSSLLKNTLLRNF